MTLLTLGVIEGLAYVATLLTYDEYEYTSTIDSADALDVQRADDEMLHPYYGHAPRSYRSDLNILPPPRRRDGTVVIAMLGGSVAQAVAPLLRNAVFQHLLQRGTGIEPVFLDLTNNGYHQPQQAIILANLLVNGGEFDAIVNLDGHEEIVAPLINTSAGVYPFFPRRWSGMVITPDRQALLGRRQALLDERNDILHAGWAEFLYGSATFRFWRSFRLALNNEQLSQLEQEWLVGSGSYDLMKHGPRVSYEPNALQEESVAVWRRSSWLLSAMADINDAAYYHFLQPQYAPASGPKPGEELATVFESNGLTLADYPQSYAMLVQAGQELEQEGVEFVDLSQLSVESGDAIYEGACCRLTERGTELLAERVLQRLVEETDWFDEESSTTGNLAPVGQGDFDVYQAGNYMAYAKRPCAPEDTDASFFLRVEPAPDDPAASTAQGGVEEWSWSFEQSGARFADQCVATVPLGYYEEARVHTGQLADDGTPAWEVAFSVSRSGE